jgi:carnitine 3-dehydrogenase
MTRFETPRVSVVGAGETGRGWAALAVANGWPVTIYDADGELLATAAESIGDRVVSLVRLHRAELSVAEDALNRMRVGRSLLMAVESADWVIEAVPEDLTIKHKVLQLVEQVARRAAIITSSTSGMMPSLLSARLEHADRFLVTRPLNPVELVPLVEVVPSPRTDPTCVEDIRFWLSMLGRAPIVFRKEVPGNIAGRLSAAVWRECIHLVLEGVLDVEDVDRAVAVGPALNWAASGPHLEHHLSASGWGTEVFFAQALSRYEEVWKDLAEWKNLASEDQKKLARLVEKAYASYLPELREARNQRLVRVLEALRE